MYKNNTTYNIQWEKKEVSEVNVWDISIMAGTVCVLFHSCSCRIRKYPKGFLFNFTKFINTSVTNRSCKRYQNIVVWRKHNQIFLQKMPIKTYEDLVYN